MLSVYQSSHSQRVRENIQTRQVCADTDELARNGKQVRVYTYTQWQSVTLYLVRAFVEISNMVPSNNKGPGAGKTTQVWSGKTVDLFNQINISASGDILVVDPSTSIAPGVHIVPVRGYNCTPIYTRQDCVGSVQGKVLWCIWSTQWQIISITAVDIKKRNVTTIINLNNMKQRQKDQDDYIAI